VTVARVPEPPPARAGADQVPSPPAAESLPPAVASHRAPSARFRREDPRELRYLLSVIVAKILSRLVWSLPDRARRWLIEWGSRLWWRLVPTYRSFVCENVRQVLTWAGKLPTDEAVEAAARTIFWHSTANFADLLRLPHLSPRRIRGSVRLVEGDFSILDDAISRGQGVMLLSAHLGAFEFAGHGLSARGYPITSLTGRTTSRFVFDAVTYLRATHGMKLAEASPAGVRRVIQALRRGECVAVLADYDFFQNGVPISFFGRDTTLPPGPIRIARDSGALVVGCFARRRGDGYALSLLDPFVVERTPDLDADIARGMARAVRTLERAIGETPEQWVMFQQEWRGAPPDPVRVFPVGSPLESELLRRVDAVLPVLPVLPEPRRAPAPTADPPSSPPAAPTGRTD
jgi:lauroyl/myristoyl acyltransferase